jgi:hypothetical protein
MNLNDLDESLRSDNPCWKGYKPVGTKKKGGRTVPNCVPESAEGVAEGSLNEDKGFDVVKSLVSAFNDSVSGDANIPLAAERPSSRVWTRSDGTRYRDHGNIRFYQGWIDPQDVAKWKATKPVEKFWDWLKSQPGVKSIGQVSGEFRRDPMRDAVAYKGQYFVLTPNGSVIWGSVSRFKNPRSVWRQQNSKQGVAEGSGVDAFAAGHSAFRSGTTKNPYKPGSDESRQWDLGWETAQSRTWNKEGVTEDANRAEAQADYMQGQCMILAVAINQYNPERYPIGYIWEYNISPGAPDIQLDDDEWEYLSPQEQQEISKDISRHSIVHAYVRDQETNEYIDARGRHNTLPNLWGRMGQTRFDEFPGTARELINITAHGDWDEVGEQVSFKRGRPAFDSLAGPAGVKRALDYAVKYLGVGSESAEAKGVAEGGFKNMYAEFSGYGNYMQGRAVNVFKTAGLEVVSKEYSEDDNIQTYVVKGDRWAIEKAGKFLERNAEQFGGYHFVKQGVGEGMYAGTDDTVGFSVNSERAYQAVMARFGDHVDHDETSGIMYVPARMWPQVEMVAFDADGEGATQADGSDELAESDDFRAVMTFANGTRSSMRLANPSNAIKQVLTYMIRRRDIDSLKQLVSINGVNVKNIISKLISGPSNQINLESRVARMSNTINSILEAAEKIGGRHDPTDFDAMVGRVGQQAKQGPMKTVWDPVKRVYRVVPANKK